MNFLPVLYLHGWNFLFIIGGVLGFLSMRLLKGVKEEGEVQIDVAVEMRVVFRMNMKKKMTKNAILSFLSSPLTYPMQLKKKIERKE